MTIFSNPIMQWMWYATALMRKEKNMKLMNKRVQDMTVGESLELSVLLTVALVPLAFLPYICEKVSEWKANRKRK